MKVTFSVPDEYPCIVLAIIALCSLCQVVAMAIVVPARKKYFSAQHMKQFSEEHKKNFPDHRTPMMGFPDVGSGRFAMKLPYKDWYAMNNAFRVHLNLVEQLPILVVFLLVNGLIVPYLTVWIAWYSVVGRIIYTVGYIWKGPDARLLGAITTLAPIYLTSFYSIYVMSKHLLF
eukprot:403375226